MNPKSSIFTAFLMASILGAIFEVGFSREFGVVTLKSHKKIDSEIDSLARFAVQEHNKRANTLLEFGRVLVAKEQVVAGKVYFLTFEAIEGSKRAVYQAKVWVKQWLNFKQLLEFTSAVDGSHFTTSKLRSMQEKSGWHKVPINDPEVQSAANYVVKIIQQRSNSLFPYQLLEIKQAETEVANNIIKYNLFLKLKTGTMEEKFKVELHKNATGNFLLTRMEHSKP